MRALRNLPYVHTIFFIQIEEGVVHS